MSETTALPGMGMQVEVLLTNLRKNLNHGIDCRGLVLTLILFLPFLTEVPKTPKALRFCFLQDKKCINDSLKFCEK